MTKKAICTIIFAFFITNFLLGATLPLNKIYVVHIEADKFDTLVRYITVLPYASYTEKGNIYFSPVIPDTDNPTFTYLLQDLRKVFKPTSIFIGKLATKTIIKVNSYFGKPAAHLLGNAESIAIKLCESHFKFSNTAIITLVPENATQLEFFANAAVLTSVKNIPFILTKNWKLDKNIYQLLKKLKVKSVIIAEPKPTLPLATIKKLKENGQTVQKHIKNFNELVANLKQHTSTNNFISLANNNEQILPAALAAVRYKGVVLKIPKDIISSATAIYTKLKTKLMPRRKLAHPLPPSKAPDKNLTLIAKRFTGFLNKYNLDNKTRLEYVITFAKTRFPTTFERAITGSPFSPQKPGVCPSRMPGNFLENMLFFNRTALYRALILANKRPKHVTMSLVAFEVQNTSANSTGPFTDNFNKKHIVNEIFGCKEAGYKDPGVYASFKKAGYSVGFHNSPMVGEGKDQINKENLIGFGNDITNGSIFLYDSSHGSSFAIYPMAKDTGIEQDNIVYGEKYWPAIDGRVNKSGPGFSAKDFNATFRNLNSIITIYNACLVANGDISPTILKHGGAASICGYVSCSFDGSGWFWCVFIDHMVKPGTTLGECLAKATASVSEIFPANLTGKDASIRYILFGDALMEFAKPSWQKVKFVNPKLSAKNRKL